MKKILVPTDLSPNSKSGIRFAIQWAVQQDVELLFLHALDIMVPTRWSQAMVTTYVAGELEACRIRFQKFINGVYRNMNMKPGPHSTLVIHGYDPAKTILDYCRRDNTIDFICISTNGAGPVMKLFGTNTSELISKSPVPVIAIPKNCKTKELGSILYASDFRNYKDELAKVLRFASLFRARVEVVHFTLPGELRFDAETVRKISGDYEYGLDVSVEEANVSMSLTECLRTTIRKRKPSMVVLFTNQERNFIQKIFLSSTAEELSFSLKVPLLVYRKIPAAVKGKKQEPA